MADVLHLPRSKLPHKAMSAAVRRGVRSKLLAIGIKTMHSKSFAESDSAKALAQPTPQRTLSCFVIMPSGNAGEYRGRTREADYVFNSIIKNAIESAAKKISCSVEVHLSARNNTPAIITEEIIRLLETADLVIADLSGRNPNVYYELGIRYSLDRLGRHATIPIIQDPLDLAFDVRGIRAVSYSTEPWNLEAGYRRLEDTVGDALQGVLNNKRTLQGNPVQSVVYGVMGPDLLPSAELMGKAVVFERTWKFRKSRFSIIASSVEERENSHLRRHFQHSTGSG